MHPLDAAIIIGFIAYAMASGLAARHQASRGLEEYFLAGRRLSGTQAGLSMAATQFAADTPLLVTGLVAVAGVFSLWRLWIYALAFLLLGFLLAPCWRRAGVLTDAELSEVRYGGKAAAVLRAIKAVYFGLVFNCTVLAMVLFATARIAEPFFPWHEWLPAALFDPLVTLARAVGVPLTAALGADALIDPWVQTADNLLSLSIVLGVTAFYSTMGGLRAVVRTDIAQLALALGGTAIYAAYVIDAAGGTGSLRAGLSRALIEHPTAISVDELLAFTPGEAHMVGAALLTALGLQWLIQINADGTGYLAQRCMACRSDRDATRATLIFSWTQIFVRSLLWLPIGIGLLILFPPGGESAGTFTAVREATYVRGIAELLPPGLRGVLLASLLAALASTLDTHLNWGASYLTNDLYARFYVPATTGVAPDPRTLVRVARSSNLVIIAVALVIMTRLDSIQTAWKASLLLGAGAGATLVLRWLWWRVTAEAEIASLAASMLMAPVLIATVPADMEAVRLLVMAAVSTAAAVSISLLRPPRDHGALVAFYRRVQPPGFWGPIAAAAGDERAATSDECAAARRRLFAGLARTGAAAVSLFCMLVGIGTLLVAGTVPAWVPWPALWSPTLIAASLLLAPTFLRTGEGPR
ncbi:MAG: sodium transporter [Candidatus Binatia bacterium]